MRERNLALWQARSGAKGKHGEAILVGLAGYRQRACDARAAKEMGE
jgi:hypothetical protein